LDGPADPAGKRRRQWSSGFTNREQAEAALSEELSRRAQGIILKSGKVTVREFADRWLEHMATLGRDEGTLERYQGMLERHVLPSIGAMPLKELQPTDLSRLYAQLLRSGRRDGKPGGLHPRTVGHVHRALHRMLKQAARWQLVARNPAADIELPSVPKSEMVTLTCEQAAMLLKAAEERPLMRDLVMIGVATGARLGELLALRWEDVDLDNRTLRIGLSRRVLRGGRQADGSKPKGRIQVKGPKTEAGYRTVILGPTTVAALRRLRAEQAERRLALGADYRAGEDVVIRRPDGAPYRPDSVSGMFREFVDKQGLPQTVHVHTLRHSAASFLAAAGVPASDIAAQLGHKDGGALALRVYVHPMIEGLTRAGAHLDRVVEGALS